MLAAFEWHILWQRIFHPDHVFVLALWRTIYISVAAQVFGVLLGLIAALMRMSKIWPLRVLSGLYVLVFRGTPVIVQIFFVYFGANLLFGFNLILFTRWMTLQEYGIPFTNFFAATLLALLVGKAVLVVDNLRLMHRFDGAPLIQPILFKSAIYWVCVFVLRLGEALWHFWRAGGALGDFPDFLVAQFSWPRFLAIQIWLMVLFLVYVTAHELDTLRAVTSRFIPGPPDDPDPGALEAGVAEAIDILTRVLAVYKEAVGEGNIRSTYARHSLGRAYAKQGNYHKGISFYTEALGIIETYYSGDYNAEAGTIMKDLAEACRKDDQGEKANEWLIKAYAVYTKCFGGDHVLTKEVQGELGSVES